MKNNRGTNSNSHGNNPKIGYRKLVTLSPEHWELCKQLGGNNYAQGIRKAMNVINMLSHKNLEKAAQVLDTEPTHDDIETQLLEFCPTLETGDKGINHLMSELLLGESYLSINDEGQIINRVVNVLELKIFSENCPRKVIKEIKQVWHKTGKVVERDIFVSEKITNGTDIETEIKRAISEELSLSSSHIDRFEIVNEKLIFNPKSAYKGIDSYSNIITIEVWVNGVSPLDIYIEKQLEKDTYFQWIDI
jgi:hypothetical protein